jgi:DNA-binding HxlR family transcriptional regulator
MPASTGYLRKSSTAAAARWYGPVVPKPYPLPGPVARSLEIVGDRWTLLVVRELLLAGRRYGELERALAGIPSNLLAERLRLLEDEGLVTRAPADRAYRLTAKGRDLAPVLASLAVWGTRHCGEPASAQATHAGCGGRVLTRSTCTRCGAAVAAEDLDLRGRA